MTCLIQDRTSIYNSLGVTCIIWYIILKIVLPDSFGEEQNKIQVSSCYSSTSKFIRNNNGAWPTLILTIIFHASANNVNLTRPQEAFHLKSARDVTLGSSKNILLLLLFVFTSSYGTPPIGVINLGIRVSDIKLGKKMSMYTQL